MPAVGDHLVVVGTGPHDGLTDVAGLEVGHYHRLDPPFRTGTTVVLARSGATCGVDVRGGAPATHETDLLSPTNLVDRVQGLVLTGGSSFGLAACGGAMAYLEELGLGWPVGPGHRDVVPILPGAAIFDLARGGSFTARPDADFGYRAAAGACSGPVASGNVGAGAGAETGTLVGPALKGGVGTASLRTSNGATVSALVVLNAAGSLVDPATGGLYAARPSRVAAGTGSEGMDPGGTGPAPGGGVWPHLPDPQEVASHFRTGPGSTGSGRTGPAPANTVIAVVATDVALDRAEATRLASVAHDGLARSVRPVHTLVDGDTIFSLSTAARELHAGPGGARNLALSWLFEIGSECVARAVVDALLAAGSVPGTPSYRDAFPSAFVVAPDA